MKPPMESTEEAELRQSMNIIRAVDLSGSVVVVLVNAFILSALWSRRRRHAARSHLFVLNLATCGLCGALVEVFGMSTSSSREDWFFFSVEKTMCKVQILAFIYCYVLNVTALGLVALDRYILIVHSLRYMQLVTRRRALGLIITTWTISGLCSLAVLIDTANWDGSMLCQQHPIIPAWYLLLVQVPLNMLILVMVTVTHWRMRCEARRNEKLYSALTGLSSSTCQSEAFSTKSARVIVQVVVCYVLAFTPIQVVFILDVFDVSSMEFRGTASYFCVPVFTLSYLVNPLLYTWKNAHLRADLEITWRMLRSFLRHALKCSSGQQMHTVRT